jgi:hypothetical protein
MTKNMHAPAPLILQPGPPAITDGIDRPAAIIAEWAEIQAPQSPKKYRGYA